MTADPIYPLECFVAKLERRAVLPPAARADFLSVPSKVIRAAPNDILADEGEESRHCLFVVSGLVSRQKRVKEQRFIMGLGLPGDSVDLQSLWFCRQDHSVIAHKETILVTVEHAQIAKLCERSPELAKALWHDTLVDASIFREWTLNVAHRKAPLRLAHFFLETATRLRAHGSISGDTFELRLKQSEIASALGLSLVHTNKSLAALRRAGDIETNGPIIYIRNRASLEERTGFDPTYLHINTTPSYCS